MKQVNIGLCGLGTVGSGTFNVLSRNLNTISARAGVQLTISHVGARRDNPNCQLADIKISRDIFDVTKDENVDIIVELIGGTTVAKSLVEAAVKAGKHVVTANKALIAEFGNELFALAKENNVTIAYEAAVAGGIPIIGALKEGLAANDIQWLAGIINGTGNFILTEMRDKGRDFNDVLKEAQELGYAEADPTFDVEGIDAAHKLVILASIAFGMPIQFNGTFTEGISKILPDDVTYAEELGYRIKHLGIAKKREQGVELRVHPTLIPESQLLAKVDGVMNAVLVNGDAVGQTMFYGPGAGSEPTASAVIADVVKVARLVGAAPSNHVAHLGTVDSALQDLPLLTADDIETAYYLRLSALDKPGVLSKITQALSDAGISIEALVQKPPKQGEEHVPVIILTNQTIEKNLLTALTEIESLDSVVGSVVKIRVEDFK